MMLRRALLLLAVFGCAGAILVRMAPPFRIATLNVSAAEQPAAPVSVDYPRKGSVFPPEITAPTFIWHDSSASAVRWHVDVTFSDGSSPLHFESRGNVPSLAKLINAAFPRQMSCPN